MKQQMLSKGMMTLAAFVLVGGTACEEEEGDFGVDQEALGEEEDSQGRQGRGMKRGRGPGSGFMANIDLSEEQQEAISAIQAQSREKHSATREQMSALRDELEALWQVDGPDADAILAKHAEMDALNDSMRGERRAVKQSMDGVLTAEQLAQISEHRENRPTKGRRGRRGGGHGIGGQGGGPRMDGMGPRGGRGGGHGMGQMGARALEQLELTEDQQAQIDALHAAAEEATSDARTELTEVRQALRSAHRSGEHDGAATEALDARVDAARQIVRESSVRTRIAVLNVLTAEQRTEFQALRAERGERRGMGRGNGRGMGRGFGRGHGGGEGGEGMGRGRGRGQGRGQGHGQGHGVGGDHSGQCDEGMGRGSGRGHGRGKAGGGGHGRGQGGF